MFNINKREKELLAKELEFYKQNEILKIDRELEDYRERTNEKIHNIAKLSQEQLADYEHEFHNTKEERGIVLAKLQAKIESHKEFFELNNKILEQKDAEIKRLTDIVNLLIQKQPNTTIIEKSDK